MHLIVTLDVNQKLLETGSTLQTWDAKSIREKQAGLETLTVVQARKINVSHCLVTSGGCLKVYW